MREESLKEILQKFWKMRKPVSAMLEVTTRCNLKCQFCYVSEREKKEKDLPLGKIFRIIDQLAEAGCLEILLLGGEPFIRKDFPEIYKYLSRKGMFIHIYSNGTLLNRKILKTIKAYPFHYLRISLYGAKPQTYKHLSGNPRAYNMAIRGIKFAKEEGINLGLYTVLNKINQQDASRMKKIARQFGLGIYLQKHLTAKSDGSVKHYKLSIVKRPKRYLCHGCLFIDHTGKLTSCPVLRSSYYDLNCFSFESAWRERRDKKLKIKCPVH
ncbi:MAG: radical SAM protein [Candidatus Omnitrophica bacterium]|nr:radical SAM protein [Candidatus Omnitrophota bacterium]MCM8793421.1 radical SAM protein [Candidatus Omnitrophota bacterium]